MARRYDFGKLNARRTDEGYLLDTPVVARTGILTYRNPDGSTRKELRLPDQVFHADSLASFTGKPITLNHPKEVVDNKNYKKYSIGTMLSEGKRQDGDNLAVDIVIHEPDHIGDFRELSLGYDVDLDETPGIYNGERYDAIQKNIRINHLSVVKRGRAGAVARLNLDADEELEPEINIQPSKGKSKMPMIRLDNGCEYEAPQEVIAHAEKLRTDNAAHTNKVKELTEANSKLQAQKDTLQSRVDGIDEEVKTKVEAIAVKTRADEAERVSVEKIAASFKVDCKDKSIKDIKIAVLTAANKAFKADGKDDVYIAAAFDTVSAMRADAMASQRTAITTTVQTKTTSNSDAVDPRDAYLNSLGSNPVK